MGLESKVNAVFEDKNYIPHLWDWVDGKLIIEDPEDAWHMIGALEESGHFGEITYNQETHEVKFGVHPMFKEATYFVRFPNSAHEGCSEEKVLRFFPELKPLIRNFGKLNTLSLESKNGTILITKE